MSGAASEPDEQYKVGRVLKKYDLLELHSQLPGRWLGEYGEATSLRSLAEQINIAVLAQAMRDADKEPLDGETENAYRLLTDDDVNTGVRTQQRNRLQRIGIDVETLEQDFVTHQAVHSYLTEGLGISKEVDSGDPIDTHQKRIQRLRSRTTAVIQNSLSELKDGDDISDGEFDVIVDMQVYCRKCDTQADIFDILRETGCDCD